MSRAGMIFKIKTHFFTCGWGEWSQCHSSVINVCTAGKILKKKAKAIKRRCLFDRKNTRFPSQLFRNWKSHCLEEYLLHNHNIITNKLSCTSFRFHRLFHVWTLKCLLKHGCQRGLHQNSSVFMHSHNMMPHTSSLTQHCLDWSCNQNTHRITPNWEHFWA